MVRRFGWEEERTARAFNVLENAVLENAVLENAATVIEPPRLPEVKPGGHSDNRVLECAVAANADYLVTGDRRHLLPIGEHGEMGILNAPRFLSSLGER